MCGTRCCLGQLEHFLNILSLYLQQTGLQEQADLKVGDGIGLGLSGGQVSLELATQYSAVGCIIASDIVM